MFWKEQRDVDRGVLFLSSTECHLFFFFFYYFVSWWILKFWCNWLAVLGHLIIIQLIFLIKEFLWKKVENKGGCGHMWSSSVNFSTCLKVCLLKRKWKLNNSPSCLFPKSLISQGGKKKKAYFFILLSFLFISLD